MKVTISDIAKMCNVSHGTVDRVLHNRPNVYPQVRMRVLEAIRQTGYQTRKPRQTHSAALLSVSSPQPSLWQTAVSGSEPVRQGHILCQHTELSRIYDVSAEAEQLLQDERFEAFLVNAPASPQLTRHLRRATDRHIPVFTCLNEQPELEQSVHIGPNPEKSAQIAAGILKKYTAPQERVLIVAQSPLLTYQRRTAEAFRSVLIELGFAEQRLELIYLDTGFPSGTARLTQLLNGQNIRFIFALSSCLDAVIAASERQLDAPFILSCGIEEYAVPYLRDNRVQFFIGCSLREILHRSLTLLYDTIVSGCTPAAQLVPQRILTRQFL